VIAPARVDLADDQSRPGSILLGVSRRTRRSALGPAPLIVREVRSSAPGGAVPRVVRVPWAGMPTSGDVAVEVVVDPDGLIAETNESDNTLAATVRLP